MSYWYAGATIVAAVAGVASAEKSRQQQRRITRNQEGVRRATTAREKMAAVREQRIAQAQLVQGAASEGMLGSSAAQGGYSAIGSVTAGNLQFANQMDSFQKNISDATLTASRYTSQAGMYNSAAGLLMQGSSLMKGGDKAAPATPSQSTQSGSGRTMYPPQ